MCFLPLGKQIHNASIMLHCSGVRIDLNLDLNMIKLKLLWLQVWVKLSKIVQSPTWYNIGNFFFRGCQIEHFYLKFKIFKKKVGRSIKGYFGLLNWLQSLVLLKKMSLTSKGHPKGKKCRKCIFLKIGSQNSHHFQTFA